MFNFHKMLYFNHYLILYYITERILLNSYLRHILLLNYSYYRHKELSLLISNISLIISVIDLLEYRFYVNPLIFKGNHYLIFVNIFSMIFYLSLKILFETFQMLTIIILNFLINICAGKPLLIIVLFIIGAFYYNKSHHYLLYKILINSISESYSFTSSRSFLSR